MIDLTKEEDRDDVLDRRGNTPDYGWSWAAMTNFSKEKNMSGCALYLASLRVLSARARCKNLPMMKSKLSSASFVRITWLTT
jgi:hypothetical protein